MTSLVGTCRRAGPACVLGTLLTAPFLMAAPEDARAAPRVRADTLALGDSATGLLASRSQRDTFYLALTGGDIVDVGVFSRTQVWIRPGLEIVGWGPDGETPRIERRADLDAAASIVPALVVPYTGTFRVVVSDGTHAPNEFYGCPCRYALRTRRAGPVLEATGEHVRRAVPEGTATAPPDAEFRVYNRGSGSASFEVVLDSAAWLVPNRPGGTVFGPGTARTPADPVSVRLAVDASSLRIGSREGTVSFEIPGDEWHGNTDFAAFLYLWDARAQTLNSKLNVQSGKVAVAPDGTLAVYSDQTIYRMDPETGAYTPWVSGLNRYMSEITFGPDSALYASDQEGRQIIRISPAVEVSTLFSTGDIPSDVEVLPDGTVFAATTRSILRRSRQGVVTTVLERPTHPFAVNWITIAYHNGWLYYNDVLDFGRIDVVTGSVELLGFLTRATDNIFAGESGRIYADDPFFGGVRVLDNTGRELDHLYTPWPVGALALGDSILYGVSGVSWRMPVADRRVAGSLVGDPSGDGQVSSMDALGILSYIVGKPLPAGWSVQLRGDADCDREVSAVDALIILSKVVGKDVSAFCVGTRR